MKVTLYTRRGCHLCDEAKHAIGVARRRNAFDYEELDIDEVISKPVASDELRQIIEDIEEFGDL